MYSEGSSKLEKGMLRRLSKQFTFDAQSGSLFYVDRGQPTSTFKRMALQEQEKARSLIEGRKEVNFPSADWLSYPRTQLTVFAAEFVCAAGQFFQRCFLETIFSPEGEFVQLL